jgi:hypothetical protein
MGGKSIGFRSCDGHTKKKLMKKKTLKGSFRLPIGIHRIPHSFSTHPTHWCKTSSPYRKCRMGHAEQPTALGDTHDPRAQRKKKESSTKSPPFHQEARKEIIITPTIYHPAYFPKQCTLNLLFLEPVNTFQPSTSASRQIGPPSSTISSSSTNSSSTVMRVA